MTQKLCGGGLTGTAPAEQAAMTSMVMFKRLSPTEWEWFPPRDQSPSERARGPRLAPEMGARLRRDADAVSVRVRWFDGHRVVEDSRDVELHGESSFLAGPPLPSDRLARAERGAVICVAAERIADVVDQERWLLTIDLWDRPLGAETERLREIAADVMGEHVLGWAFGDDAHSILELARGHLPAFGRRNLWTGAGLDEEEWLAVRSWLAEHVRHEALQRLLEAARTPAVEAICAALGESERRATRSELAAAVVRRYGDELLARRARRRLLVKERFRHAQSAPEPPHSWVRGGPAAHAFVRELELPSSLAGRPTPRTPEFEEAAALPPLGPLHDYQRQIAAGLREVLGARDHQDRRAVVWLPTGTGKTRVTVETLLMEVPLVPPRNVILWIADREELCEQAIASFRHVWMVRGRQTPGARARSIATLRIARLYGGRGWQDVTSLPTLVCASVQTLASRVKDEEFELRLAELGRRCAAVVFDEAHHVVAPSYGEVIRALGLGQEPNVLDDDSTTGAPLIGLTATPFRSRQDETEELAERFHGRLVEPEPPYASIRGFIRRGYLSRPRLEVVATGYTLQQFESDFEDWRAHQRLPATTLAQAGRDPARTAAILADLEPRLDDLRSVLVFACSVEHAQTIAEVLSRRGHRAESLHGGSSRAVRHGAIRRFRSGILEALVTCELLTTGFDAPNCDAVVLARPVESPVLFAQMVGRGLRGPKNGGTAACLLLDYEDNIGDFRELELLRAGYRTAWDEDEDEPLAADSRA